MDWEQVAKTYSGMEESRQGTVYALLADLITQANCHAVLDHGGGDGSFLKGLRGRGVDRVALVEPTAAMRELAAAALGPEAAVLPSLEGIAPGAFDACTCIAVWMEFKTEEECLRVLRGIHRALTPAGIFLAAVTHPCFRDRAFSTFRAEFNMRNYLKPGVPFDVRMHDGGQEVTLRDTHWPLASMVKQLNAAGFFLDTLLEIGDTPEKLEEHGCPPWLVITARKR